jgi:peptidoglycan/LPS O-acetylase OafA/YrhL
MESGYMGVTVFFTLSGFVLTINYFESLRRPSRHRIWAYAVARFARIYPLYLLIFVAIVAKMKLEGAATNGWLQHLLVVQAWSTNGALASGYNGPALSVSVEVFLYACFPLVAIAVARIRSTPALLATVLIVVTAMTLLIVSFILIPIPSPHYWLYQMPLTRLGDFTLGMLAARIYLDLRDKPAIVRTGGVVAISGAAALVLLMTWPPLLHTVWGWDFAYVIPSVAIIFGLAIAPHGLLGRTLSLPVFVFLGEASYALFLCHKQILGHFGSTDWVTAISPVNVLRQLLVFMLILGIAVVLHKLVEVPARAWIRRLGVRQSPQPLGALSTP